MVSLLSAPRGGSTASNFERRHRVRPTAPGQDITGAFMTLQSVQHTKLIKVESDVASTAEIHSMSMRNGVMQMRELKGLDTLRQGGAPGELLRKTKETLFAA